MITIKVYESSLVVVEDEHGYSMTISQDEVADKTLFEIAALFEETISRNRELVAQNPWNFSYESEEPKS